MQSSGNRSTNKMGFEEEKNLKSGIKVTYVQCQPKFNSSLKIHFPKTPQNPTLFVICDLERESLVTNKQSKWILYNQWM